MKKVELLSPCGNFESLVAAVQNGADAVYFGGKNFGARKYAQNFNDDEIVNAIKYCHLYGVKVYITVNTLINEDEIDDCIRYIRFLHINNVDALIMQDIGLISLVRKIFPNLEIHASTQMHNHNQNGIEELKKLGVKRVVLARELSLDEIKKIDVDIEKEVFIHGALCVCYSGCCLFSSMNGGRSGNRGACVGSCRLPYKLLENGKETKQNGDYPLSLKSLCTITKLGELIESGITSFKIEGRMKSAYYTGYVTRLYREKIDEYYKTKNVSVSLEEINNLKKLYNREFTLGYLFNSNKIANIKTSNHIGVKLGEVIDINKKYIKVKLDETVYQEDAVRFDNDKGMILNRLYNKKGLLINKVLKGDIALFDNKINLKKAKIVLKTIDSNLYKVIDQFPPKKILVKMNFKGVLGKNIELEITDGINKVKSTGIVPQLSVNSSATIDNTRKHLEKLGDTPFVLDSLNIDLDDNLFIPIKSLNDLRRDAIHKLISIRENYVPNIFEEKKISDNNQYVKQNDNININVLVRNEEQLKVVLDYKINNIYVDTYALYKKYKHLNNVYFRTPRINNIKEFDMDNMLINDIGLLKYGVNKNIVTDSYMNVTNSYSLKYFLEKSVKLVCLSYENELSNIKNLAKYSSYFEIPIYGRCELMVMKYCPIKMILNNDNNTCSLCMNNKYSLKDSEGHIYPFEEKNHITTIYHYKSISRMNELDDLVKIGISNFRVDLFDEKEEDIRKVIEGILKYGR